MALHRVGDGEGDLGAIAALAVGDVFGERQDVAAQLADERHVRIVERAHQAGHLRVRRP